MGSFQASYETNPGPAPPRWVILKIGVDGMEGARVAELKQRVRDFASKLPAEFGVPDSKVEVTTP